MMILLYMGAVCSFLSECVQKYWLSCMNHIKDQLVYWPGIDNDIDNTILACQQCQDHLPSNPKEPIIQKPTPERPFQEIAVDLCSHAGRTYLIIVDCFTDWPAIISLDRVTNALQVISAIRQSFCRTAIPDVVWSDGGP